MSLNSTLSIANSSLIASQIGLQVASNNLANAATPGYARQIALLQAVRGSRSDPFQIGAGVGVASVRRQIDQALQERLWSGTSDQFASAQKLNAFNQLEAILNEGTEFDTSSQLTAFFNSWSEATTLLDSQSSIVNQGESLTSFIRNIRGQMMDQRRQIEDQLDAQTVQANALFQEIADINGTVSTLETGDAEAAALRDRRDQIVSELSQLVDVNVNENAEGLYDVFVGSTPVVLGTRNRGVDVDRETIDGVTSVSIRLKDNRAPLPVEGGSIGGLLQSRDGAIDSTIEKLDTLASSIIFEVNKIHSTGRNVDRLSATSSTLSIASTNRTLPINDPNNAAFADLPFAAQNGSFTIEVYNADTETSNVVTIPVDLDGLDANNLPGVDDDTTPEDIRAALDAIPGVNATFTADGKLDIAASPGFSFSFVDDTSGVLAVMGVNSFFTGTTAQNIDVREGVEVMLGRTVDGQFVENGNALEMGTLVESAIGGLGDRTFSKFWSQHAQDVATQTAAARTESDASNIVRESLEGQRAAISGVSIDEESMNLLLYQRQYQAAAQVVQVTQSMFDTLLSLV
ncbi:MAG: flagellar hook-associated protein FlgK [Phycisphaerales bacterium]